jgi:hypothetical protein
MLPQIEMLVNIRYRIPGETRPILFSDEKQSFVFTLVENKRRFFMYNIGEQVLWEFDGMESEEELVRQMDANFGALERGMKKLVPDDEGEDCVERILARDETVIPVLAEKFLDYTPEATHEWEENPNAIGPELEDEEAMSAALETLAEELAKKVGPELDEAKRIEANAEKTKVPT